MIIQVTATKKGLFLTTLTVDYLCTDKTKLIWVFNNGTDMISKHLNLLRLVNAFKRNILNQISTLYWKLFLAEVGSSVKIHWGVTFHRPHNVFIGDNVSIGNSVFFGSENDHGKLYLGKNVQINSYCIIDHSGNVIIEENALISERAVIYSHSHGYDPRSISIPINKKIGSNVWIGSYSLIGENATFIADRSIIASGSVVVKDCCEKDCIYGGVPAKKIENRTTS